MTNPTIRPILLVEDSIEDIKLITAALRRNDLANALSVVRDGAEALDYLMNQSPLSERPVVILLDLKMPRVDGFEVLREVKQHKSLKLIPVVVLTSSEEERDLFKSYQLGANAYVVKPVEFEKLVDTISQTGVFWALVNHAPSGQEQS